MKNPLYILIAGWFLLLSSCEPKDTPTVLAGSNGRFNEVIVVTPYKLWEGKTGNTVKKILQANVPGLPQAEPLFSVMHVTPDNFSGSLRKNRNIIRIKIGENNSVVFKNDVNAHPQAYIFVTGKTEKDLTNLLNRQAEKIIDFIHESDLKSILHNAEAHAHREKFQFFQKQQLHLSVPRDYDLIDDREDFIWFRKRFLGGNNINGSMNIFGYVVPGNYPYEVLKDSLISLRNEMGKKYIPGPFENSYLTTEAAYTPHFYPIDFNGLKAYKILGKWEIINDFQAGPFVNITVSDPRHRRVIIVEGVVFAPAIDKRDMIFELEALIRSLKIEE